MSFVRRAVVGSIAAVAMTAALAAIMVPVRTHLSVATTALVLVVPVVVGVVVGGFSAGVFAVVSGFLVFDYVFIPPYYTFNVGSAENWTALVVYAAVMLLVASVVSRLDKAQSGARAHEESISRLFELTDLLIEDRPLPEVLELIVSTVQRAFGLRSVALLLPAGGRLEVVASAGEELSADELRQVAPVPGWWPAWASRRAAGTWRRQWRCRPRASRRAPRDLGGDLEPPRRRAHGHLRQPHGAHPRAGAAARACPAHRATREDRPVAAGVVERRVPRPAHPAVHHQDVGVDVAQSGARRRPEQEIELLELIDDQADRLDRLVTNLLDLEPDAGRGARPAPRADRRRRPRLRRPAGARARGRRSPVTVTMADDLPLVDVDHVLIGQVLKNLHRERRPPRSPGHRGHGVGVPGTRRPAHRDRRRRGARRAPRRVERGLHGVHRRGRRGAPVSACPSPRHSSRPTARRSGWRRAPGSGHASASPCRWPTPPRCAS